ncbi:hypothetical protein BKA65DRAFT_609100 [Rhexocercosporidium sp. MPI-PUGE-AT-0058]|nr:hypothetical protein BKA65DRAFT_609100 [Rhexocercosporidium sp. MPI-PUGE-AT-0058]
MAQAVREATSHTNPRANKPDDVPRYTKQPKSRQPSGFREKILRTPLPYYSGPYSVGMMYIEVPVREPRHFSDTMRNKKHLLELETVLFSVFYPSGFGSGQGTSPEGMKKWSRPTWLPRPRIEVAKGYGKFAGLPTLVIAGWFGVSYYCTKLPAFCNATIAEYWPPDESSREVGYKTKNRAGTPPPDEPKKPCFPTTYSSVRGEFASYGFVVVSLEHREGSGPRTFMNMTEKGAGLHNGKLDLSDEARSKGYSKMDSVFPKHNNHDTMPGNKQGVDAELRSTQIQLRLAEIEDRRGLSFLRHKDRFEYIGQGIIYDIWEAAIQPPENEPRHRIDTPLLAINSEAFMFWPDNLESVMSLCHEAKDYDALVWLMTVRGSVYISQSDFSLLYPRIASLLLKMTVNPRRAIDLNIKASLEFLKKVMPARISAMNRGTDEHLLDVRILDKLPTEYRLDAKWTAMCLRIPHELRIRLRPQWVRRHERRKRRTSVTKHLPQDSQGNVLEGLEDLELGEEIWMHVAPTKDELDRHGRLKAGKELENHQTLEDLVRDKVYVQN